MNGALKKIVTVFLSTAVFVTAVGSFGPQVSAKKTTDFKPIDFTYDRSDSYDNYKEAVEGTKKGAQDIDIPVSSFAAAEEGKVTLVDQLGKTNVVKFNDEPTWITYEVEVPEDGLYEIAYSVCGDEASKNDIQFALYVNDEMPFNESNNLKAYRGWKNNPEKVNPDGSFMMDTRGNELRPSQVLSLGWRDEVAQDPTGLVTEAFQYKFKAGKNTIKIVTLGEIFYLGELKLLAPNQLPTYEEVKKSYDEKGYQVVPAGTMLKVQAEKATEKATTTLYPVNTRGNSTMEPSDVSKIRLNSIGGANWKDAGQWIVWELDAPVSGLYQMDIKYKQSGLQGMFASRKIYIDGKIPFQELSAYRFNYSPDWEHNVISSEDGDPYLIYLEEGKHELKMEVTLGDTAEILNKLNESVYELNDLYRKIIMISSTTPDTYRDYKFESTVEGLQETLTKNAAVLREQVEELTRITGVKGAKVVTLENFAEQMEGLAKKPNTFNSRLESYKNNISTLSQWVIDNQSQPIEIDYIMFTEPSVELPRTKPAFFRGLWDGVLDFFNSFVEDYSVVADVGEEAAKSVKVWVGSGRDQASIINGMITDDFTPQTGINIQLELVQGALIESTLAGKGPDVAMSIAQDQPINFAIRGALVDLSSFDGFEDVTKRFTPSAMAPYEFQGKYYAIPESQTYNMMFYRKDVLSQLELGVPETWDDFFAMLPVLNRNNLQIGCLDQTMFQIMLYQNGGTYYKDDKKSTGFDEDVAKETFKTVTECFTKYSFPITYDFYSRFRTGEMPISIQLYTEYNRINAAAPEIKGLWDMAEVPGVMKEDGTIDHSEASTMTGMVMFQGTKEKEAAWEFMKWYTDEAQQTRYALELEGLMGPAGRYAVANTDAFENLTWTREQKTLLKNERDQLKGIPELPGSYYMTRGLTNAFRTAVIEGKNPYSSLYQWNKDINNEIARKYEEFGLN